MKKILKKLKPFTNEYFILLLVMLTAFAVRLYKITNPVGDWHAWRQADTISVSRIYLDYRIDLLNPRYYDISPTQTGVYNPSGLRFVEFPIYNLVNVLAFKAFPKFSLELWARLISVACAVSSVFFIFLIGKKLLNSWGGLLSAFFYALIPYIIYFTRVILPEPMTVLFLLISIWFFCKFTEKSSSANLYLSSIFLALSILLKPFVIFYFPL